METIEAQDFAKIVEKRKPAEVDTKPAEVDTKPAAAKSTKK